MQKYGRPQIPQTTITLIKFSLSQAVSHSKIELIFQTDKSINKYFQTYLWEGSFIAGSDILINKGLK